MDLVDRYVHAVRSHLPVGQQEDIANELTDDILSKIKDTEVELGRPLDEAEQAAVLKQYGHPYLFAMRYRPQQHLIGPAVFPFYWTTLKVTLAVSLAVHVIVVVATHLAQHEPQRILSGFGPLSVAIQSFFWVTVVFAAIDFSQARLHLLDGWSPRSLPRVAERSAAFNRSTLLAEFVGGLLFLAWWLAVPYHPVLILGPAASFLTLSPAWHRVYVAAAVPGILSTLMAGALLMSSRPTWLAKWRPLLGNLATLATLTMLIRAGDLVMPAAGMVDRGDMVQAINNGIRAVLAIISIVAVAGTVHEVVRRVRDASL
jgi:hypothetical protein